MPLGARAAGAAADVEAEAWEVVASEVVVWEVGMGARLPLGGRAAGAATVVASVVVASVEVGARLPLGWSASTRKGLSVLVVSGSGRGPECLKNFTRK